MNKDILIYIALVLLVIIILGFIIKKAVKLLLFIAGIIVLLSLYNIFVKGVSPIDEFNAYITNIQYGKEIAQYSVKIKSSVDNIKDVIESKKIDESSIKELNDESAKLQVYLKEVKILKHTEKLNTFHEKYCEYLDTIVATTDTTTKLAGTGSKTIQGAEEILVKLKNNMDNLLGLKTK